MYLTIRLYVYPSIRLSVIAIFLPDCQNVARLPECCQIARILPACLIFARLPDHLAELRDRDHISIKNDSPAAAIFIAPHRRCHRQSALSFDAPLPPDPTNDPTHWRCFHGIEKNPNPDCILPTATIIIGVQVAYFGDYQKRRTNYLRSTPPIWASRFLATQLNVLGGEAGQVERGDNVHANVMVIIIFVFPIVPHLCHRRRYRS